MFIESPRFPEHISAGSRGGPAWQTEVVSFASGREQRNIRWSVQRCRYDVSFGVRRIEDLELLTSFFYGTRGKAHTFRYKDWADYKSCSIWDDPKAYDQPTVQLSATEFQLVKNYDAVSPGYQRIITKPVAGTVKIAIDGVEQTSGWSVDTTTGIVTFDSSPSGAVGSGYEYDVPCRFDTDELAVQLEAIVAGSSEVPVVEIKL